MITQRGESEYEEHGASELDELVSEDEFADHKVSIAVLLLLSLS
jgi:hypothetical protein